jgi:hypothetical protein
MAPSTWICPCRCRDISRNRVHGTLNGGGPLVAAQRRSIGIEALGTKTTLRDTAPKRTADEGRARSRRQAIRARAVHEEMSCGRLQLAIVQCTDKPACASTLRAEPAPRTVSTHRGDARIEDSPALLLEARRDGHLPGPTVPPRFSRTGYCRRTCGLRTPDRPAVAVESRSRRTGGWLPY